MGVAAEKLRAHPGMLVLARESRELTQAEVAVAMTGVSSSPEATPVSQGYVSRAEAGRLVVTDDRLTLYAAALAYPPRLLCVDPQVNGVGVGLIHHRKRASLGASTLRCVHAQLAMARLQVTGLAAAAGFAERGHRFVRAQVDEFTTPKDAARQIRRSWAMSSGPVPDVVGCLEDAGALVLVRDLGSDLLDAISQWDGSQAPLLLINNRAPGDRCRFSVAHELGHLVMHAEPGASQEQERQADAFAAEFLMPASDIREAFAGGVDLARLSELKRRWRVSMSALLRRALTLGCISDWQYRTAMIEMSALGYRTAEPVEIPREEPQRVPRLVHAVLSEIAPDQAAACAHLLPEDFRRLYVDAGRPSSPVPLRR